MGALIEKIKNMRNGSVMMAMNRPVKNSSTMTDSSPFCFSLSLSWFFCVGCGVGGEFHAWKQKIKKGRKDWQHV